MKIDLKKIDKLNSTISISIEKKDYENKVDSVIKDYKSKINLPGFRKGHVPLSLIKKKYEKAIVVEETNKILSKSLNQYIVENNLKILGNPVPILDEKFDWNKDVFNFFKREEIKSGELELIFLDAPYKEENIEIILENIVKLKLLKASGLIVLHRHKNSKDNFSNKFNIKRSVKYGISKIIFGSYFN